MRIALLSWESLHAIAVGGVAVHVSSLAAALSRQGHDVHAFTRMGAGQRLVDNIFGVHIHRCPFVRKDNFVDEIKGMSSSFLHYFQESETAQGPFDIIHCHDWLSFPAALAIQAQTGRPLTMTFHTTEWGRSDAWPESGDARRIADLEQDACETAGAIIAVSYQVRRELEALYHPPDWKTSVIFHGIDTGPFDQAAEDPGTVKARIGVPPLAPMVLFVGRLHFRKGPDVLLEAAARVRERMPDVRFVFVGEGAMREHLERDRVRLGLQESVLLLGWRQGRELIDLYRACDLVAIPSRSDAFGMVLLSAWAASKPVVATATGAQGECIHHQTNGWVAEPTAEAFAEALLAMCQDFDQLRWMGRNGRVAVETAFTWDTVAKKTVDMYHRCQRGCERYPS